MAKSRKSTKTGVGSGNRELLTWALQGLEQEIATTRTRLQELEAQARRLRTSSRGAASSASAADVPDSATPTVRKKRKLSADARRRIAEAQKRRWAKARAGKE